MDQYKDLLAGIGRGFIGRASIVLTGSVLGQGLAFLMLPLLSRVYSPESIGRASTTLAIFSMLAIVICLQYDQAVVVASRDELPYLLLLGCLIALGIVVLLGLILIILSIKLPTIANSLTSFGVNIHLFLLLLTYAPFLLLTQLHLRLNNLMRVSSGRFIYYGLGSVFQVIGGYIFGGTALVFLSSQIIAALLSTVYLLPVKSLVTWSSQAYKFPMSVLTRLRQVAQAYINFPKYQAEAQFANAISVNLPVIFLRLAFSEAWAGWYFLAWRIVAAPTTLISQAVGQVFYRDSAERERKGEEQGRILERVIISLMRISLLPAVSFGIIVPVVITSLIGPSWAPAATIIQILLLAIVVTFFTSPISTLVNIKGLQAGAFFYYNMLLCTRSLALVIGWMLGSAIGSVWVYTLVSVAVLFLYLRYVVHSFGGSFQRIFKQLYPLAGETLVILAFAFLLAVGSQLYQPFGLVLVFSAIILSAWREARRFVRINLRTVV